MSKESMVPIVVLYQQYVSSIKIKLRSGKICFHPYSNRLFHNFLVLLPDKKLINTACSKRLDKVFYNYNFVHIYNLAFRIVRTMMTTYYLHSVFIHV